MPNRNMILKEDEMDPIDEVYLNQRMQNLNNNINNNERRQQAGDKNNLPPELTRK